VSNLGISRRQFLSGLAAAPLMAVAATSAYASLIEPFHYWLSETDVFIRDLPERFENFRITQLTDIHHSRILGIDQVQRVVALAQQTEPDMFVLTGAFNGARASAQGSMKRRYDVV
jgi:predicted MPP superfamily phosphohydrolase